MFFYFKVEKKNLFSEDRLCLVFGNTRAYHGEEGEEQHQDPQQPAPHLRHHVRWLRCKQGDIHITIYILWTAFVCVGAYNGRAGAVRSAELGGRLRPIFLSLQLCFRSACYCCSFYGVLRVCI